MRKTVLIPTDFTVKSLNLVKSALNANENCQLEIIILHGLYLPDSITEMLFFRKKEAIRKLENPAFEKSCQLLLSKYGSRIESLGVDLFSGYNRGAFENYLEGNRVDEIYAFSDHDFKPCHKRSFDLMPLIEKTSVHLTKVKWVDHGRRHDLDRNQLAALFFGHFSPS
ncbi:hypothetical protein [Echinicola rosea]|uniref:Universal stress protein n=1 Tax=Echinicola rosea TaxID=1807691 RepID=A0ABQ1VC36_9BACT|nr:hypothetical protein [Echinicola rosea]GGF50028.1 hypothetical protein GCM10011339_43220 [Echinicola rosea]